jgi:hypothetical protein
VSSASFSPSEPGVKVNCTTVQNSCYPLSSRLFCASIEVAVATRTGNLCPRQGETDLTSNSAMNEVVILSDIPEKHPGKAAIEDRLHAAVLRIPGPWRVEVLRVASGSWWLVCFERPTDGFRSTILLSPWEHDLEHISRDVDELLARA